ncbi:hypothetical protein IXB28_06405 [Leptothoe kymatousa TAU-MAC 1615]|uniref:Uncharacterized protein n=1 Tax=Leptothoe kymatousa TAU-MAC 1615 TaxID=2364775 RepID=A0ABS5Y1Z8_9CYAN|nr:hypothetical protein [Leptothoe kymatousa TAU-MAC 1615]
MKLTAHSRPIHLKSVHLLLLLNLVNQITKGSPAVGGDASESNRRIR